MRRDAYYCSNRECELAEQVIVGPREAVKHYQVGYDILAYIGILRTRERKTLEEIRNQLQEDCGLTVAIKTVSNWVDVYLQLVTNKPHPKIIEELRNNPCCILSIDGIKPKKGEWVLYICRDVVTGTILAARTIQTSNEATLTRLLEEVKALGIPLKGIVSDKQRTILMAVQNVFPKLPHQHCQFHYIKNIAKQLKEQDTNLRKGIRKRMKAISRTLKTARKNINGGT